MRIKLALIMVATLTMMLPSSTVSAAAPGPISTAAGNGTAGYSGDGGPAIAAKLQYPSSVAVTESGEVYIADSNNNVIRKVATNGTITTVVGGGTKRKSKSGTKATDMEIGRPYGLDLDANDNLYVADYAGSVYRIDTNGVTTVLAQRLAKPYDVAVGPNGEVYVALREASLVVEVGVDGTVTTIAGNGTSGYSGDGGAATNAQLHEPNALAADDNGNVYISDGLNQRIRKVTPDGVISTVAGTGTPGYSGDGGAATKAQLNYPTGLDIDNAGALYIGDAENNRIRRVTSDGVISTVAGTGTPGYSGDGGTATNAQLNGPGGSAVSDGRIYIADFMNHRVRTFML